MMKKNVIHIVESLDKGAVENWLVRMFEFSKHSNDKNEWTFFCIESFDGRLEKKVLKLGGKIIKANYNWSKPLQLIRNLRQVLVRGKYDVVHSHHDFMCALYLLSTINLSVKKIIHIHNMDEHIPTNSKFKALITRVIFRHICCILSDSIIGISKHTLNKFTNGVNFYKKKSSILYYGYPKTEFINLKVNKPNFRKELNIPENAIIILFCGRMDKSKNPLFAVKILAELVKEDNRFIGLFVGNGPLKKNIYELVSRNKLNSNFKFLGWSDDVPNIMANSDVFISPHVHYPMEGFGLVVLEAQLGSLPVIVSKGVSTETFLDNSLCVQLSLNENPRYWSKVVIETVMKSKYQTSNPLKDLSNSPFDMSYALNALNEIYE